MTRLVIAGVSTRAAADSAARAGFAVTAVDAYADRDQHPTVGAIALPRDRGVPFTAAHAAKEAATIAADAAAYLSNFDNEPSAVATLAANRSLWGNPPDVLRRARDPQVVAATFRGHGFSVPRVELEGLDGEPGLSADRPERPDEDHATPWLIKPLASGGGHGIRRWRPGQILPANHYRQQYIDGTPGSVIFVAAGGRAVVLGVSRQLIGDERFGGSRFRYCGNVLAPVADPQFGNGARVASASRELAAAASANLNLVGVNGIDFVAQGGTPLPIEINPRWTASTELVERLQGLSVFDLHASACRDARLPAALPAPARATGKAIVYARRACVAGNTDEWCRDPDVRDVPHAGDSFAVGAPVCTVFASGDDASACEAALVRRADLIYAAIARWPSLRAYE